VKAYGRIKNLVSVNFLELMKAIMSAKSQIPLH